jgi:hypothetical protein
MKGSWRLCRGYDLQACLRKDTPRPQDDWHDEFATTTMISAGHSPSKSIDAESTGTLAESSPLRSTLRAASPVAGASSTQIDRTDFLWWLQSVAEQRAVYCSGRFIPALDAKIMNPGVPLPCHLLNDMWTWHMAMHVWGVSLHKGSCLQ